MTKYLLSVSIGAALGTVLSGWGYVFLLTYGIPGASLAYYIFIACLLALSGALNRLLKRPAGNVALAICSVLVSLTSLALALDHPVWELFAERMAISALIFFLLGLVMLWWRLVRLAPPDHP